jgi:hypothetical protein
MECFALGHGEGEQINFRGTKMYLKVSKNDSEGKYSLIEMIHPPNIGPALHPSKGFRSILCTCWRLFDTV